MKRLNTRSTFPMPMTRFYISAGNTAVEVGDDCCLLDVNALITNKRDGFLACEVTGDSMVDQIYPTNIVFVDTYAEPRNGDIIAATVNGLTCIKVFKQEQNRLYLVSANTKYDPCEITADDNFHILGVVKSSLTMFR